MFERSFDALCKNYAIDIPRPDPPGPIGKLKSAAVGSKGDDLASQALGLIRIAGNLDVLPGKSRFQFALEQPVCSFQLVAFRELHARQSIEWNGNPMAERRSGTDSVFVRLGQQ